MINPNELLEVGDIVFGQMRKDELQPHYYLVYSIIQDDLHLLKIISEKIPNSFKLKSSTFSKEGIKNIYIDTNSSIAVQISDLKEFDTTQYKLTTKEIYDVLNTLNEINNDSQSETKLFSFKEELQEEMNRIKQEEQQQRKHKEEINRLKQEEKLKRVKQKLQQRKPSVKTFIPWCILLIVLGFLCSTGGVPIQSWALFGLLALVFVWIYRHIVVYLLIAFVVLVILMSVL